LVAWIAVILAVPGCSGSRDTPVDKPLRVGWQPPWANQGQIVAILKKTDLLAQEKCKAEFVPFSYGGPMIEAALAGRIDVVFAGEQPVLNLVSKTNDWRIVARLTRYRSAILVPPGSPITKLSDLEGKRIATAFGSTTHRDFVLILTENGLDGKVKLVSLDQAEHAGVIEAGGKIRWGDIDGIATYDPTIASTVNKGSARILHSWASPGLMAVRAELIASRPDTVRAFLRAYRDAYVRYADDPSRANAWYSEESRLPLTDQDYAAIASFEPNLKAKGREAVDIRLSDGVLKEIERHIDAALKIGIMKARPDLGKVVARDLAP
jgi:ABC-type nitrate/sulfonate/bicarbonate transport system substrate-binding protein